MMNMEHQICNVEKQDYLHLIKIWEVSVRATHDFLSDKDIDKLKLLILNNYFDNVLLHCNKNMGGDINGFIGVAEDKIEMLFISPNSQGHGIGSALCQYAIQQLGATKVDVNEQNPRAIEFYKKMGFSIVNRSELDGQGKPYPILNMEVKA
jgi:putative acetyltransferase